MTGVVDDAQLLEAAKRGDRRAREHLVEKHLPLVRAVAWHYRGFGLPFDDLVQEGSVGLLEAIERYDPARGADFETYARFRARRAIRNSLTKQSRMIRLPKQVVDRRRAIERVEAQLTAERNRVPSAREIGAALGLPPAAVIAMRNVSTTPVSLDQSVLPDGSTLESVIADAAALDPAVEAVERERAAVVDGELAALPGRQREILERHFGLGRPSEEIADVARHLHLSQQRARTIERDALYALRDRLESLV